MVNSGFSEALKCLANKKLQKTRKLAAEGIMDAHKLVVLEKWLLLPKTDRMVYKMKVFVRIGLAALLLLFAQHGIAEPGSDDYATESGGWMKTKGKIQKEAIAPAIILNYLHTAMFTVVNNKDRVILEQQYNDIINNFNLSKIKDEEIIKLVTKLMNTLSNLVLSKKEKEYLNRKYEAYMEHALQEALASELNDVMEINWEPLQLAASVLNAGNVYVNYINNTNKYRLELGDSIWKLDKTEFAKINGLREEFLLTYWLIMKQYNIPDKWRVTEKQLKYLDEIIREKDNKKKHRRLKRLEKELGMFPLYWVYMASSSYRVGDTFWLVKSIEAYERLDIGLLRNNSYAVLMLELKSTLYDANHGKSEISNILDRILALGSSDPNAKLFVSLNYARIGDPEKAIVVLNENIDDGVMVAPSLRLKVEISAKYNISPSYDEAIKRLISEYDVSIYDYFHFLSRKKNTEISQVIMNGIRGISIQLNTSLYGNDDIEVRLPKCLLFQLFDPNGIALIIGKDRRPISEVSKEENGSYGLLFESAVDRKDLIDGKYDKIALEVFDKDKKIYITYKVQPENSNKNEAALGDKMDAWIYGGSTGETIMKGVSSLYEDYTTLSHQMFGDVHFLLRGISHDGKCYAIKTGKNPSIEEASCEGFVH